MQFAHIWSPSKLHSALVHGQTRILCCDSGNIATSDTLKNYRHSYPHCK